VNATARLLLAAGLAWLLCPHVVRAAESQDACAGLITPPTTTIRAPGTWCMTKNEAFSGTHAIVVEANDVTVDCNGFTLTYVGAPRANDSAVRSGNANLTIRNCTFKGFGVGLNLVSARAPLIEHNIFDTSAVHLTSDAGVLRDNQFFRTQVRAQGTNDVIDNTFSGADSSANGGLEVTGSFGSIRGNRFHGGRGIVATGGAPKIRGNELSNARFGLGAAIGIDCIAPSSNPARLKDNFITGFATPIRACADAGGNITSP
jgi:hypothetical protein